MSDDTWVRTVVASWDEAAGVWVASSDDVPGLVAESGTLWGLAEKLRALVPELLVENGQAASDPADLIEVQARLTRQAS